MSEAEQQLSAEEIEAQRYWNEFADYGTEKADRQPERPAPSSAESVPNAAAELMLKQFADINKDAAGPSFKVGELLDRELADYPEIAKPVKDALAPIEQRLEAFQSQQNAARAAEVNAHIRSQQDILEAAHPGWEKEFVQGQRAREFAAWINSPDRSVKEVKTVYETNRDHIFDAQAAIDVFDAFAKDTGHLSAKRAAQLEGTRSLSRTGRAALTQDEAYWRSLPDDNPDPE
ncbi:hypothetical protein [Mesorhizobium sp.]|uniref:hypothetical protein n=1 Tax=Mesorhizobium sp. TaxID=1871066 RepID=UPI000FEA250E|nr:hypothetical protein [Mesorhizobium sp.]RWD23057.1 MAG: hypothetical protein EOS33_27245 [Mesorhizobium sp.]